MMLPNPLRNRQQNVQPLRRFAETAENHFHPISHVQNLLKLAGYLIKAWFLDKLKVEAADAPFKIFEAEKASVRAAIGDVQVKLVIQPINGCGSLLFSHTVHFVS
jgi:hypothetical protein